jgi:hypothetical protein
VFVLPIWAFLESWAWYYSEVITFKIIALLLLQIFTFILFVGYFTHLSAKAVLANDLINLTSMKLRIKDLINKEKITTTEIKSLKKRYYGAVKYRYLQRNIFGFIPMFVPILNDVYVKSNTK